MIDNRIIQKKKEREIKIESLKHTKMYLKEAEFFKESKTVQNENQTERMKYTKKRKSTLRDS